MFGKIICGLLLCASALAQPIKIIVPFSPGGQVDIIAREAEQVIVQELKLPVIVEYRLGAGSAIGITGVARTKTNEVMLMFIDANALANVFVSENISMSDFKLLGLLGTTSTALIVIKGSPFKDLKYWATVKRPITVGTNGVGSPHHFYTYSLSKSLGVELEPIPYKGVSPAINDLFNGSIDAMWGSVTTLLPFEEKVEFIANLSTKRLSIVPNMPTFTELGYPAAGASTHWMIVSNSTADNSVLKRISDLFFKLPADHPLYTKTHIIPETGSAESILKIRIQQQQEFARIIGISKIKQ